MQAVLVPNVLVRAQVLEYRRVKMREWEAAELQRQENTEEKDP